MAQPGLSTRTTLKHDPLVGGQTRRRAHRDSHLKHTRLQRKRIRTKERPTDVASSSMERPNGSRNHAGPKAAYIRVRPVHEQATSLLSDERDHGLDPAQHGSGSGWTCRNFLHDRPTSIPTFGTASRSNPRLTLSTLNTLYLVDWTVSFRRLAFA